MHPCFAIIFCHQTTTANSYRESYFGGDNSTQATLASGTPLREIKYSISAKHSKVDCCRVEITNYTNNIAMANCGRLYQNVSFCLPACLDKVSVLATTCWFESCWRHLASRLWQLRLPTLPVSFGGDTNIRWSLQSKNRIRPNYRK